MAVFTIKKNQVAVQGFQPNRSYTKDETDKKFISSTTTRNLTISQVPPSNPQIYDLWIQLP